MRRVVVLALTLLALAPASVRAAALYQCAGDHEVRTACCCPAEAKHHQAGGARPELRPACCCTVTRLEAREATPRAAPPAAFVPASVAVAPLVVVAPLRAAVQIASRAAPRPPRGPPGSLFARRCALLL